MAFPAGLTLVSVTCQFDTLPSGGAAGTVRISYDGQLTGPTDNSIVPYVDVTGSLSSGTCTVQVPATNGPGWTPQDFAYTVAATFGTKTRRGTLQLDYQTTSVNLADLIQWDGAAVTGTTYATLAQLGTTQSDLDTLEATVAPLPAALTSATATANLARYGAVNATDHGLAGWSFDPANVQAATILPTAGIGYVARIQLLQPTVSAICFHFTAGGSGLTGAYAALYNDAGALFGALAVTNNQASAESNWSTSGYKECPLIVGQGGLPQYSFVRAFWWFTGTTGPQASRGVNSASVIANAGMSSGFRFATAGSGLTTAAPGNIPTMTGGPTAWWVGLKP